MLRRSITEYLDNFLKRNDDAAYIHKRGYRTVSWSYRQVAECAFRFARELEARDIQKGDRVLLWGDNCAEWVVAFLGCVLRGAVAVPLDRASTPDFAARICRQVDAKLVVVSSALVDAVHFAQGIVILEELADSVGARSKSPYEVVGQELDDPVEIVFTSGSTSEPKGVVISHRNVLSNLAPIEEEIAKYIRYERPFHPIRFLNLLPLSHVFGQFLGIFIPQLLGGVVYFQETLGPSEVMSVIRREHISVCVAVPRLIDALKDKLMRDAKAPLGPRLEAAKDERLLLRWWRFRSIHRRLGWKFWAFICGGAALSAETEDFWRRLGYVVIQGYGMTETTSLISLNHPFKVGHRSIGKVLPGREIKLDENGEILVRGKSIASSYWAAEGARPVTDEEGWLRTGDLGALDEDGNLYFKGRKKNVIVTPEGLNVYPEDLEAALRQQPQIRDAVVIGLTAGANTAPYAVLLRASAQITPHDLEQAVSRANTSLADFQKIRQWTLWPEADFPRTSTQKVRINVIEEALKKRVNGQSAPNSGSLAEIISQITGREAKPDADLGLSSLDRVELTSAIEDRYLVDLDDAALANANTISAIERLLRNQSGEATSTPYPYPRWQMRRPVTWIRIAVYYLLIRPATGLLGKPRVCGAEQLGALNGPALIISNHITAIDIGLLMYALPARYRTRLAVAMSGELLRAMRYPPCTLSPVRRLFEQLQYVLVVALFNVQSLPQQSNFTRSFNNLGDAAGRGYSPVVFPEGKRTTTGEINPFRSGIGLLAQRLGLPVVPMRIDGLFALKQAGRHWAGPNAITVRMGTPLQVPADADPEEIARDLQQRVATL